MLETRQLTRRFGGLAAVDGVSLSVAPGELRSIIGPNGAGKSTFFNLITGAFPPTSGRISFMGEDITGFRPEDVFRLGIVRSFQISHLFSKLTVRENVTLMAESRARGSGSPWARRTVPAHEVERRVDDALARVNLGHHSQTIAGTLSHGDRRLVEIAMALAAGPRLLLLDEPTAGMSPDETRHTARLLRSLVPAVGILLVEHDMSVVMAISDRVSVLHRGRLLADGTPDQVRRERAVQDVYFGHGA